MKIIRYLDPESNIRLAAIKSDDTAEELDGDLFENPRPTGRPARIARLLTPIQPTQILCVGLNYRLHAEETKAKIPERPVLFMKSIDAILDPGQPIQIPAFLASTRVDYECELAAVISRPCKNVDRSQAMDFVLGFTCANDVSARDHQIKFGGSQWCRGKSFDTFAPLGPCLVTPDEIQNPNNLRIRTRINGETLQDSNTSDMIFSVADIIEYLSASTTLPPGTVILTGTPQGVGMARRPEPRWLRPGDLVEIEIEKIGTLSNPVELEPLPGGRTSPWNVPADPAHPQSF